jgi:hypothetical protein
VAPALVQLEEALARAVGVGEVDDAQASSRSTFHPAVQWERWLRFNFSDARSIFSEPLDQPWNRSDARRSVGKEVNDCNTLSVMETASATLESSGNHGTFYEYKIFNE